MKMKCPFTSAQLLTMLELQDQMNSKVNPDWRRQGWAFTRAIMVETVEAMEHHGWKWWKHQARDLAQLEMELVDIWHFALAHMILEHGQDTAAAADAIPVYIDLAWSEPGGPRIRFDNTTRHLYRLDTLEKMDLMAGLAASGRFEISLFLMLMKDCGLSADALFRQYIGKGVLNFFRQDNGYKDGTYHKTWAGREDNEHLTEVMLGFTGDEEGFPRRLYQALESRYITTTGQ